MWDMDAHHLVMTWPIPDPGHEDYAALMAAAQWLNTQFFSDVWLKEAAGLTLAGADLFLPEGTFFYVSASLRPPGQPEVIEKKLQVHLNQLAANGEKVAQLGSQLSFSLRRVPNPATLRAQASSEMSPAMIEANAGLWLATQVHRYRRTVLSWRDGSTAFASAIRGGCGKISEPRAPCGDDGAAGGRRRRINFPQRQR